MTDAVEETRREEDRYQHSICSCMTTVVSLAETLQSTQRQAHWRSIVVDVTSDNGQMMIIMMMMMMMTMMMVCASENTVSSILLLQTAEKRCYSSRDEAPVSDCRQMILTSGGCRTTYCCNTSCNTRTKYVQKPPGASFVGRQKGSCPQRC